MLSPVAGSRVGAATLQSRAAPCALVATAQPRCSVVSCAGKVLLEVKGLEAKVASTGQQILNGVDLVVHEGEVHAIMGKNGSGKSTLSKVLVGHPDYEVTAGTAAFKGKSLFELEPEERSHLGLFLSFQSPRLLDYIKPDFVHIMQSGQIVKTGDIKLVDQLEAGGYKDASNQGSQSADTEASRNVADQP
ncbi:iron-sulfur cluster assembly protein [Haematococcus lacustris]|uniref:Iron-sulfur cluster assembly protein n=1 Tax=Haematococcus lacustris TaxID=44745 RepID=A0A699YZB8_HAELA|nr:iron-sulfur cluster assembly protein [Haematococcus lacustris]